MITQINGETKCYEPFQMEMTELIENSKNKLKEELKEEKIIKTLIVPNFSINFITKLGTKIDVYG